MTEEQKIKELLKPRYKVMADYPQSIFNVGDILWVSGDCAGKGYSGSGVMPYSVYNPEKYPHLFRKLEWWEDRKPEEIPKYVKWSRGIFKLKNWHTSPDGEVMFDLYSKEKGWWSDGGSFWIKNTGVLPATSQEYLTYINKNQ